MVKDLQTKNVDLSQRLEIAFHYDNAMSVDRTKANEAEMRMAEGESKLEKAKVVEERLKNELHDTECQVIVLTRQVDYVNEHYP